MSHIPIMVEGIIQHLDIQSDDVVLDCTLGFGGHARAILTRLPRGVYVGIDQDPVAIQSSKESLREFSQCQIVQGNFGNTQEILSSLGIQKVTKILIDLGMSSVQLDDVIRGFSFQHPAFLDMRMNPNGDITAADILANFSEEELLDIFAHYSDLRADRLVQNIRQIRQQKPITQTTELVEIIKKSFFFRNQRRLYITTCQRVFQALRIAVNKEEEVLHQFLSQIDTILAPDGRVAFLTFHSLEDRAVKEFQKQHDDQFRFIPRKPIRASQAEIRRNSRAKSAKLRLLCRLVT